MTSLIKLSKEWHFSTALYDAIDDTNLRQAASLLLEKHANPNVIIPDFGITPFHLAVGHEDERFSKEITKLLLKNGGDPNVIGIDGVTPLHIAVAWNRPIIVRMLLSYGADPWIFDDAEKNSFHYAFEEQSWDSLKTLEIFRRTQNLDMNEKQKNKYSIQLDKVIIHANDVQAEYKPHFNGSCCDTSVLKQSVGTQTPLHPIRVQPPCSSDVLIHENKKNLKENDQNLCLDDSLDWCQEAQDLMITDDCKRKIMLHRSRSKVYEYSPYKQSDVADFTDQVDGDTQPKLSSECCCQLNDTKSVESKSKDEGSPITVKEKVSKILIDVEVQATCSLDNNNACNNLVHDKKITSSDSILFSEESLISDDQSDCPLANVNSVICQRPIAALVDETASLSSPTIDNTCHGNQQKSATSTPQRKTKEYERDEMKTVSWSQCLKQCTCMSKRLNDSDSFTADPSNAKFRSALMSGVERLPEDTASGKSNAEIGASSSSGIDVLDSISTSALDPNISIELKYTDEEDGIEFIEAKLPLSLSSKPTVKIKCEPEKCISNDVAVEESEHSDGGAYDTDYIRKELKKVGFISGPITGTPTKRLYLKKLRRIKKTVSSPVAYLIRPSFSSELEQALKDDNWLETLAKWSKLENDMRENFTSGSHQTSWRNGSAKTSFTYLLLDPRISDNLPARYEKMELIDVWRTFTKAIFYVGKGTRSRPYEHLYEALLIWGETKATGKRRCSLKVKHILDIWRDGMGIVCVQAFEHLTAAEAYTREAAMIDAIGLPRLKNEKCGMYYGVVGSWNSKVKKRLGSFLLYRALRIFIAQNEIQLKPTDI